MSAPDQLHTVRFRSFSPALSLTRSVRKSPKPTDRFICLYTFDSIYYCSDYYLYYPLPLALPLFLNIPFHFCWCLYSLAVLRCSVSLVVVFNVSVLSFVHLLIPSIVFGRCCASQTTIDHFHFYVCIGIGTGKHTPVYGIWLNDTLTRSHSNRVFISKRKKSKRKE